MQIEPTHENPPDTGRSGYERSDASFGPTFKATLYILGTMVLTAVLLVPVFGLLARREAAQQPPPPEVLKSQMSEPQPTFPRLLESEPRALAEFRAQEDALLQSYGWVEKDRGLVRIPIGEAMRIVAERGLPKFPVAPGTGPASGAPGSAAPAGNATPPSEGHAGSATQPPGSRTPPGAQPSGGRQ
jgi:hypothetical protein